MRLLLLTVLGAGWLALTAYDIQRQVSKERELERYKKAVHISRLYAESSGEEFADYVRGDEGLTEGEKAIRLSNHEKFKQYLLKVNK